MNFGFSYVGLLFLILLFVPNLLWTANRPQNYDQYVVHERQALVILERIGEVLVCCVVLIFSDFNVNAVSWWSLWLLAAVLTMVLYEIFWLRYFRSPKTMADFYGSLLGIPVAGATLPVLAFFLLGIYGRNPFLIGSVVVLGIGHIGIHWAHRLEIQK